MTDTSWWRYDHGVGPQPSGQRPAAGPYWCRACLHRSDDYGSCDCRCHERRGNDG